MSTRPSGAAASGVTHGADFVLRACGVHLDAVGPDRAADRVVAAAIDGRPTRVHLCNAYTLSLARQRPEFGATLDGGDLKLMDGMPLVWAARRAGATHLDERVYGPDLMLEVMRRGRDHGLRHYLYGSTPETLDRLVERLPDLVPGVAIAGAESPPFRPLSDEDVDEAAARVAASGADVVWIGLGTPKQDEFVAEHRDRFSTVLVAVGAAFDFHAGMKRQAPRWMQRAGLEWLFRLATEPRRLWRRYLIGNTVFLAGLFADGVTLTRPDPADPESPADLRRSA